MRPMAAKPRRKSRSAEALGVHVGRFKKALKRFTRNVWQHVLDSLDSLDLNSHCTKYPGGTEEIVPYQRLREIDAAFNNAKESAAAAVSSSVNSSFPCSSFSYNLSESEAQSGETAEETILLKISVLGDCEAGKTSFVNKYIYGKDNKEYVQTVGIVSMEKALERVQNVRIALQIWDMGGNSRSSDVMASICKDAAAILFMFDLTRRSSLHSVKEWFVQARQWNKRAIPVMVGTKYDHFIRFPHDIQRTLLKEARYYAQVMGASLFFSSVPYNINIQKVFKIILAKLFDLPCNISRNVKFGEPIIEY